MGYIRLNKTASPVGWFYPLVFLLAALVISSNPLPLARGALRRNQSIKLPAFRRRAPDFRVENPGQPIAANLTRGSKIAFSGEGLRLPIFSPGLLFAEADRFSPPADTSSLADQVAVRVYVPGLFALPVVQQPEDDVLFVSSQPDKVTQFRRARSNGVTGLLAHNYLAGQEYYQLEIGEKIWIAYEDGNFQRFEVVSIQRYQKLEPRYRYSNYKELESGRVLSSTQVFNRFYKDRDWLIFQTCLKKGGNWSWGLLFVVAEPI
jgi:hypothetical protein